MKKIIYVLLSGLLSIQVMAAIPSDIKVIESQKVSPDAIMGLLQKAEDPRYSEEVLVQILLSFPFEYRQYVIPALHKMKSVSEKTRTMPGIIEWRGKLPTRIAPELKEYAEEWLPYLHPAFYPVLMPEAWPSFYEKKEADTKISSIPRTYLISSKEDMAALFPKLNYSDRLAERHIAPRQARLDATGGLTDAEIQSTLRVFNKIKSLGEGSEGQKRWNDLIMLLTPDKIIQALATPCASLVERLPQIGAGEWLDIQLEEEDGELVARVKFDPNGEAQNCEVFMAEDCTDSSARDWTRCEYKRDAGEDEQIFRVNAYRGSARVFAFVKARYSCGFAVSSKIAVKRIEKQYVNMTERCRILYSSVNKYDSFVLDCLDRKALGDCFLDSRIPPVRMIDGPHNIQGIYSAYGLKLFRFGDERYRPLPNALLKMDLYSSKPNIVRLCIAAEKNNVVEKYYCNLRVEGGECWADRVLYAKDFKTEENKPLSQFSDAKYISFHSEGEFCINNLLWL